MMKKKDVIVLAPFKAYYVDRVLNGKDDATQIDLAITQAINKGVRELHVIGACLDSVAKNYLFKRLNMDINYTKQIIDYRFIGTTVIPWKEGYP